MKVFVFYKPGIVEIWQERLMQRNNKQCNVLVLSLQNLASYLFEYIQYYLKPGSSITYNFNASSQIDFFIASGQDLYDWNLGGSPSFFVDSPNVIQDSGVYNVLSAIFSDFIQANEK